MKATANLASGAESAAGESVAAAPAATGPFVLNLCSSTTPMALAQTDLPELKRFSFFVSRRFEEGRERFRLHMGHFATLAEAEEWLAVVREIYPGAWAGEAPGRKLRERAAAAAAAQAQHAAGPQAQARAEPVARAAPAPRVAVQIPIARVPVVHAPPQPAHAAVARTQASATARGTVPARSAPPRAAPASPVPPPPARPPAPVSAPSPHSPLVQSLLAQQHEAAKTKARAEAKVKAQAAAAPDPTSATTIAVPPPVRSPARAGVKPVFEDSNVREVLRALSDASPTGETRQMVAPPPALPPPEPTVERNALSDTQVLKLLEARRTEEPSVAAPAAPVADGGDGVIPLLKPDDTGTREALKDAVVSNAPVAFAVQLQWSVQAIDLGSVPPLAIFSAYTLYTVEGSRDGRRWYGLRLGFFSDAISAKQVAHYVRSEFASVAVVPVSPQEKVRATAQDAAVTLAAPAPVRIDPVDEFKLIDEAAAPQPAPAAAPAPAPAGAPVRRPVPRTGRGARTGSPRPGAAPAAGKVGARERRGPQTLEETLEILGAGELSIDDGRSASLNESGVRHLRVEVQAKNSPFSRLLDRLSERLKKP